MTDDDLKTLAATTGELAYDEFDGDALVGYINALREEVLRLLAEKEQAVALLREYQDHYVDRVMQPMEFIERVWEFFGRIDREGR